MTRINCIDPLLLSDAHAGAEYRELPRLFGLVRAAIGRGETPDDPRNPSQYTLGQGHCRFFYSRLGYLVRRYAEIVRECKRRGRVVNYETPNTDGIGPEWFGDWEPDESAVAMNVARIVERGGYDFRGEI